MSIVDRFPILRNPLLGRRTGKSSAANQGRPGQPIQTDLATLTDTLNQPTQAWGTVTGQVTGPPTAELRTGNNLGNYGDSLQQSYYRIGGLAINLALCSKTRPGQTFNQDTWGVQYNQATDTLTLAVFDGMGSDGFTASRTAKEALFATLATRDSHRLPAQASDKSVKQAHATALHKADQAAKTTGSGSTASLMTLQPSSSAMDGLRGHIANVGDSRIGVQVAPDELFAVLTHDWHAALHLTDLQLSSEDLARRQAILDQATSLTDLQRAKPEWPSIGGDTPQTAFDNRNGLVTSLGKRGYAGEPVIETASHELPVGSRLVLATDGLFDNLTQQEITHLLHKERTAAACVQALVCATQRRFNEPNGIRRKPDDVTVIVADIKEADPAGI